jgi:hypothetical protein
MTGWTDRRDRDEFMMFVESIVVRRRMDRHPEVLEAASPIARVRPARGDALAKRLELHHIRLKTLPLTFGIPFVLTIRWSAASPRDMYSERRSFAAHPQLHTARFRRLPPSVSRPDTKDPRHAERAGVSATARAERLTPR